MPGKSGLQAPRMNDLTSCTGGSVQAAGSVLTAFQSRCLVTGKCVPNRPASPLFLIVKFLPVLLCVFLSACSDTLSGTTPSGAFTLQAEEWPEAGRLFRQDPQWLGGDGASSVDLGSGRVLWLFGDSFIGRGTSRDRHGAAMVRNTVAIQQGYNPETAGVTFYWGSAGNAPDAFFKAGGRFWYWPGSGVMVRDRLLVFLMEVRPDDNELGFSLQGWSAVLVKDPRGDPPGWQTTRPSLPENGHGVITGSASCLVIDEYVYAFGTHALDYGAYLVRWRVKDAHQGNLKNPEWWSSARGWTDRDTAGAPPAPVFDGAQMEFSVHYEPSLARFLQVQTASFNDPCLIYRTSRRLTGPWSKKEKFYRPPETDSPGLLVYAGKAHGWLKGADLLCTYNVNSLDLERLLTDNDLYYPVFVKISH